MNMIGERGRRSAMGGKANYKGIASLFERAQLQRPNRVG